MDIFLLLMLILCVLVGFFQGMIRLIVAIVAFYLSLVLASLYYPVVGDFIVRRLGSQRFVGEYVGFAMVLFIAFVILLAAGVYTFRYAKLPGQLQYLDRIVGTVLGVALGALIIGISSILLYNLMVYRGGCRVDFPVMRMLCSATRGSFLIGYFGNTIISQAYAALDPVLPDGARLIFLVQST
jgi:membrane protein required for colicin V production